VPPLSHSEQTQGLQFNCSGRCTRQAPIWKLRGAFYIEGMAAPLVVNIPHRLGRDQAISRLKGGLREAQAKFGRVFTVQEEAWTDNRLQFRLAALAQSVSGTIDVFDDHVRLEVFLPWLLAKIAEKIQPVIQREAVLLLDKK
jgi:putative polyhydroxyalkanoic acid system protein